MVTLRASLYAMIASLLLVGAVSCDSQTTPEGAAQTPPQATEKAPDQTGAASGDTKQ